ncbi:hypothetical protein ADT71_01225 [Novosphingobium sp. ST904]|nr:hypothetical protein ADT71_01225 [Novosphingobium sp. ST904]
MGVLEPEAAKLCASEVKNMADVMERLLKDTDSSQGIVRLPQLLRRKARAMADADAENRSALREPALAPIRLRAAS